MATRTDKPRARSIWFAAHVVVYFEQVSRRQARFIIWENVHLIFARSGQEAARRAQKLGRDICAGQGEIEVDGKPGRMVFGGVRKVISCAANPTAKDGVLTSHVPVLYSGIEATYSEFVVRGRRNLRLFIAGKPISVKYEK